MGSTPEGVIFGKQSCLPKGIRCRGAVYLYAPCSLSRSLLPQSGRAGLLFLCPRSPSFLLSVSPTLQSPFGFPVAFCRSYRLFSFSTVFQRPCLPSGSPVAFRFSRCLPVLLLLSGSPIALRFSYCLPVLLSSLLAFCVLIQRERAGDLPPAPCLYAIFLRCLRRTLIISSWKYNSCLPSTRYHSPFCVKQ